MKSHINGTLQPPKEQPIWIQSTKWQNYNGCVSAGHTFDSYPFKFYDSVLFLHLNGEKINNPFSWKKVSDYVVIKKKYWSFDREIQKVGFE